MESRYKFLADGGQIVEVNFDSQSLDAFGIPQVSQRETLFDAQLTYGLQPLLYEQVNEGGNSTITHDTTNRNALFTFTNGVNNDRCFMQTFEYFRYQPGKGQEILITFNFGGNTTNVTKFAQYGDDVNAYGFRVLSDGSKEFYLNTGTTHGNQTFTQANWSNQDDDVDLTKQQIFFIQFEALYVGKIQFGFQIEGKKVIFHEIDNANNSIHPYIQSANLPVRIGMEATGNVATSTMSFNCTSVISSGGQEDTVGYPFNAWNNVTAANGTRTHVLSVQPRLLFNSFESRGKFRLESVDFLITGNNPVLFEKAIGQDLTAPSFAGVNTNHSQFEVDKDGTLNGAATMYFDGALLPASGSVKGQGTSNVPFRMPLSLDYAGAQRLNGRLSIIATGLGGTSAVYSKLNWKEIY